MKRKDGAKIAALLLLAVALFVFIADAQAATSITFRNRTGATLYVYYDILDRGERTYCDLRHYGGKIAPSGRKTFSVPKGKIGFFNFRTCAFPCNSDCPGAESFGPYKDIDVTVKGTTRGRETYNLF